MSISKLSIRRLSVAMSVPLLAASVALASGGGTGADIQITGSASTGSPDPGALFSYTFQVKNIGPDTASAVSFRDPLPLGTGYVSATANGAAAPCAMASGVVTCSLGALGRGAQTTIAIQLTAPSIVGTFANTATASSTTADPQTGTTPPP